MWHCRCIAILSSDSESHPKLGVQDSDQTRACVHLACTKKMCFLFSAIQCMYVSLLWVLDTLSAICCVLGQQHADV